MQLRFMSRDQVESVLIDTWWNVNIFPDFVSSKVSVF